MDELDDDVFDVSSLDDVADVRDGARSIVGALDHSAITGHVHEMVLGLSALDDEVPDETCACRCGCEHPVGAHGPATCPDCRHGRHRGSERRNHR